MYKNIQPHLVKEGEDIAAMVEGNLKSHLIIIAILVFIALILQFTEYTSKALGQESNQSNTTKGSETLIRNSSWVIPSDSSIIDTELIPLLLQIFGGGSLAGLAIFGANVALDKYRRPKLVISNKPVIAKIELTIFDFKEFFYSEELRHLILFYPKKMRSFTITYNVHRIIVRNDSSYPANECKASIRTKDREEKICWTVPQERYKMTINPHSSEYLDVLASLEGDPAEIFNQLKQMITQIEEKHNSTNQAEYKEPGKELTTSLRADYPSVSEIPLVILPTEDGWKSNPRLNRPAPIGDSQLVITSQNGRSEAVEQIRILDHPTGSDGFLSFIEEKK